MSLQIGQVVPDFEAETTAGHDQVSRLDRRFMGGALLPPQGLHSGVHDRARHAGADEA